MNLHGEFDAAFVFVPKLEKGKVVLSSAGTRVLEKHEVLARDSVATKWDDTIAAWDAKWDGVKA